MFFYDPKTNKHFCQTDDEKIHIVSWADKGLHNHIRMMSAGKLRELFDTLPICYSKIIYDPEKGLPWIQYEGTTGHTCKDLEHFIKEFDISGGEECAIAFKRYTRAISTIYLPKQMALSEYYTLKGFGLSKAMISLKSKEIISCDGEEQKQCIDHLQGLK